jgi:hypothetical protein
MSEIAKKLQHIRKVKGSATAQDIKGKTKAATILFHSKSFLHGKGLRPVFSFIYKNNRPAITVKRYGLNELPRIEKRFKVYKKLIAKGAPIVEPIEWHVRRTGPREIFWKEKYVGTSVGKIMFDPKINKKTKERILKKYDEAMKELFKIAQGYMISELVPINAIYNPKTKKVLFTDIDFVG